jgi:hypothetical protein
MGVLKRLAFYAGLVLGLATVAVAGAVILTYLFTGKLPAMELGGKARRLDLLTPDEVVALVRDQVDKAKAARAAEVAGGESDDGA